MSGGVSVVNPSKIGNYLIRGTVGEGAFSVVKLAFNEDLKQYFACKIVPKSRLSTHHLEERFEYEIRINQQIHHNGIVGLIDILKDELNYYIMMEFCPNGELFQYIVDHGRLKEDEARQKIRQILETLQYIHKMGITHRDLKPENILIDQFGQMKISDFGLSRFADKNGLASTPCGSPCYASPECISGHPYNAQTTDVWSVGVILYAMVTGQLPWTKRNQTQLFEQIRKGEYTVPSYVSYHCSDFIVGLMTVDITKRLTIEQALNHPFLKPVPPVELESSTPLATMISLKKVDKFFDKDIEELSHNYKIKIKRCNSFSFKGFDNLVKAISPNDSGDVKVRRRVVKVKKSDVGERKIVHKKLTHTDKAQDPIRKRSSKSSSKEEETIEKKHKHSIKKHATTDLEASSKDTAKKVIRTKTTKLSHL